MRNIKPYVKVSCYIYKKDMKDLLLEIVNKKFLKQKCFEYKGDGIFIAISSLKIA